MDDFFVDIKREANFVLSHRDEFECNELIIILSNTKDVRWLRIAFNLQVRKQMLKMKTKQDKFEWDPMIIDADIAETALNLMNMMDLYTVSLSLLPTKKDQLNGYRSKHSNASNNINIDNMFKTNDMALKVHCFHVDIIKMIVTMTFTRTDFTITSGNLSKKFGTQQYSSFKNMVHIQLVCQDLRRYGLLEIESIIPKRRNSNNNKKDNDENKEPSQDSTQLNNKNYHNEKGNKAGGNRKWSKVLIRKPISKIKEQIEKDASFHGIEYMNDQQRKAYCNKIQAAAVRYLNAHNISELFWSAAFGTDESLKAIDLGK